MYDRSDSDLYAAFRFAGDIDPEERPWLWPRRIPLGTLTLLIGDPGVGKSLLVADLAARVSAGLGWPDENTGPSAPTASETKEAETRAVRRPFPQGVVLVCPEDGAADTLRPRLAAAGADLARVCILEGVSETFRSCLPGKADSLNGEAPLLPLMLPAHADVLEQAIRAVDHARLVVLDPLHAVLSGDGQAGLCGVVGRLAETAHSYGVAVLAVSHLVKTRSLRVLYRVRGSLALIAGARAVQLVHPDADDPDRRVLCALKTVYGPPPPAMAFHITAGPRLEWESQAATPVARAWAAALDLVDLSAEARSALSEACDWLSDHLAHGPRPARQILREARATGLSLATLRRAKRVLAVRSLKPGMDAAWLWSLDQGPYNEDAQLGGAHK
jgi:hypothetical protein